MSGRIRKLSPGTWVMVGVFIWLGAIGTMVAQGQREGVVFVKPAPVAATAKAPAAAAAPQAAAERVDKRVATPGQSYVGEAKCLECHDDRRQGYFGSPHHRTDDPRTPASTHGCETCHGPGSRHIEDPGTNHMNVFSQMSPQATSAVCTTCHNRGDHALWDGSQHESRGLTCTTCHSVHAYKSESKQLKSQTQFGVCAQCHRDKIAKVDRSGHMPVREGKMQCSTCHNPHGSTNVRLLRQGDSISEACTSCHADKRGPFLWEHAPVRDGCTTCHDPHGSSNERMLVAKSPLLCQRCHVAAQHPSTIYDASLLASSATPNVHVYARACASCHSAIHGSNHPSGQRFIR